MLPGEVATQLRDTAATFREHALDSIAIAYEQSALLIEDALATQEDEPLTLAEAAKLSAYSADHLGRLVREGTIPNSGRKGAPRIARGDLPIKPGAIPTPSPIREISRTQIVRSAINEGAG